MTKFIHFEYLRQKKKEIAMIKSNRIAVVNQPKSALQALIAAKGGHQKTQKKKLK